MSTPGRLKLRSKDTIRERTNNNELIFVQSTNVQEQEKIKELWKFLDLQCDFQPFKPLQSRSKLSLYSSICDSPYELFEKSERFLCDKTCNSKSTFSLSDEDLDKKRIWYHGLRFFQKIGLDKAVLFKDKCKFCLAEKDLEKMNGDYNDTMSQTYDELKAEMESYDERLAVREVKNLNIKKN